jgi:hypothetical protein
LESGHSESHDAPGSANCYLQKLREPAQEAQREMTIKLSSCLYIMIMEYTVRVVDGPNIKPAIKLWLRNTTFSQYGDLKQLGTSFWRCSVGDQYMHQLYIIRKGTEGSLYTFIMDLDQGSEADEDGLITGQVMAASPWNAAWDWFRIKK